MKQQGRHTPTTYTTAFILSLLLGVVVPLAIATGEGGTPTYLAIAVMAVSAVRFGWLVGLGEPRLMELSMWTFAYVFVGLSSLVQFQTRTFPTTTPWHYSENDAPAMWAALVCFAVALIGASLAGSRKSGNGSSAVPEVKERRTYQLAVISLGLNGYYLISVGPLSVWTNRLELMTIHASLWPGAGISVIVVSALTLPALVAFVGLLKVNEQRQKREERRRYGLLITTVCTVLYSVNPVSSPRYVAGTVMLTIAAALGAYATPKRIRVSAVSFLASFVVLFPLADMTRGAETSAVEIDPLKSLTSGDFDAAMQLSNSIHIINENGIQWGWQLLGVPLFWVPRDWWPGKPVGTGMFIAEEMGYDFTNLSSPLPAELLINGGWPLLAVGMLIFAWAVRRRDDLTVVARAAGGRADVFAQILPFYMLILMRGSLLSAAVQLSILWVAARFIKKPLPGAGKRLTEPVGSAVGHQRDGRASDQRLRAGAGNVSSSAGKRQ